MTALEIAANPPTVSSLRMYPTCRSNRQSSLGRANSAVSFEQSIFSEIHESKTFSTAFPFDLYLALYLYVNGVAVSEVTDTLTHARTHKLSTVTLAAHARRGLMKAIPVSRNLKDRVYGVSILFLQASVYKFILEGRPLWSPFLTQFLIFKLFKLCAVTGCVTSGSFWVLVLWAPV